MPFNPINTITGNGTPNDVVATYTTGSTSWSIATHNLPGQALTGSFPNSVNSYSIQSQNFNYAWPYRGGKNLSASGTHSKVPYGVLGVTNIGVVLFSPNSGINASGLAGTTWTVNAGDVKIFSEDAYSGAPNQAGVYHYIDSSFVQNNAWDSISGRTPGYTHPGGHSKIIGWAKDGYPIYGPYGYSNALSASSSITLMTSGYKTNNKANRPGTRTLVVNGAVSSATSFAVYSISGVVPGMTISGGSITTSTRVVRVAGASIYTNVPVTLGTGTVVSASFSLGSLVEDWDYSTAGASLDLYNGRYCVTPDFPNGTYAYFITQDTNGVPTFPYVIGPYFYGSLNADSDDSTLSSLTASAGTLSPSFASTISNYLLTVNNVTTSVTFTPVSSSIYSTLRFNNTSTILSGVQTPSTLLSVGYTTSTIRVTSQYITTTTYTISINRLRSSNNLLKSLYVTPGTISPVFVNTVTTYTITVDSSVTQLSITPTKDDDTAVIAFNGVSAVSGFVYTSELTVGRNVITVDVTAQDNSVRTYTINATRLSNVALLDNVSVDKGTISPIFNRDSFFYNVYVANTVTQISVKGTLIDSAGAIFIDGTNTPSNTFSTPKNLNLGVNAIELQVVSSDRSNDQFYRVTVVRGFSNTATLSSLLLTSGTLVPSFRSTITNYVATVTNNIKSVSVVPTASEVYSTIIANNASIISGFAGNDIPLYVGSNMIYITVTAPDKVTQQFYTINITRLGSSNSLLSNFVISNAVISPSFSSTITNYFASVGYTINSLKVTPTAQETTAIINVNNISVISGQQSNAIPLSIGTNTIRTLVTAENGVTTSTYNLTVVRKANYDATLLSMELSSGVLYQVKPVTTSTPSLLNGEGFDPSITNYTSFASHFTTSTELTVYKTDSGASLKINGVSTSSGAVTTIPVVGYNVTNPVTGKVTWFGETVIDVTCTAADPFYVQTSTIIINRLASSVSTLTDLIISSGDLSPPFSFDSTDYFVGITYSAVSAFQFKAFTTDPTAQLSIDNIPVKSGEFSQIINVPVGTLRVPILVTAADLLSSTTYNIYINRAAQGLSTNALLTNMQLSVGQFLPTFNSTVTVYNSVFTYDVSSLKIKPFKSYTRASIKVNNITVASGEFSQDISLPVGSSSATIEVTAEDSVTKKVYQLNFLRIGNSISTLKNLYINSGYLEPRFDKDSTEYNVEVIYGTKTIAVKPFLEDTQSQVSVDGFSVLPGTWSQPVTLNVGDNLIKVIVLAGNLIDQTTYTIKVTRQSAKLITPVQLFLIDGTGAISANYSPDTKVLRVYTIDRPDYALHAEFPNAINSNTLAYQNIELLYPYKGGEQTPAAVTVPRTTNGIMGITLIGIPLHDPDTGIRVPGLNNTSWSLDAVTGYDVGDIYSGRPTRTGEYYYTDDRFIRNDAWVITDTWNSDYTHDNGHSKIIGFAADGYPIYGPYGYSIPTNSYSSTATMVSGYTLKLQNNRPADKQFLVSLTAMSTDNLSVLDSSGAYTGMRLIGLTTGTEDIFVVSVQGSILKLNQTVNVGIDTIFTGTYKLGTFIEDWVYTGAGTLDIHNGRYCVTPDYPSGTYAYFTTPTYPYIVGNTFYGNLSEITSSPLAAPAWSTPVGFIVTATELIGFSRTISAVGSNVSYKLITGKLPLGLTLNTSSGVISGIPSVVFQTIKSDFIVRALNPYGVSDRRFSIDVQGATPPVIRTPGPKPKVGPSEERYLINGQFVDFMFTATYDVIAPDKSIVFYIEDGDGVLPPGLTLLQSGRLYGQVKDSLSLYYRSGSDGRYDAEGYDFNPYEHQSQQAFGVGGRFINKTYKFFLTAANGTATVKAEYQIDVNDPTYYVDSLGYPIAPQWMSPADLGSVRSNTTQVIQLETYDCDPSGGTVSYDWNIVNQNNFSILPPGLSLNPTTGVLSGHIQYSPSYSTTYTFKVRVVKYNIVVNRTTYRDKTFTLTILGAVLSKMTWITDTDAGSLYPGEQSELSIKAIHEDATLKITYALTAGSLPPGISISTDGSVQGSVPYGTGAATYNFTIRAIDSNASSQLTKQFTLKVIAYTGNRYTKIILQPLLSKYSRDVFSQFINDQYIFNPALLYRPYDPAFGSQKNIEFILEYGIEQLNLEKYVPAMQNYFSRRKLYFGDLKTAFATDNQGKKIYEVVYLALYDNMINNEGANISSSMTYDNTTLYPNSIDNMRGILESIAKTDEYLLPKFMRTVQDSSGVPLGRILCMPLCYCLPGNSQTIIRRIEAYEIDFKKINFDIDRLTVLNSLDNSVAKYLLFPNREV